MSIRDTLDNLKLDWDDLTAVHQTTNELLREISVDREGLRAMVDAAREDEHLFDQCERHRLLDKISIYDGGPDHVRLRLHISTREHLDRPHDHRFSFMSRILRGGYRHTRHELVGDLDPDIPWHIQEDNEARLVDTTAQPRFTTMQREGSTYALHHTEVHTTFTTPDTVSLFLRGPAEKERSLITERETGRLWWRYGAEKERPDRRERKQMTQRDFDDLAARLHALQIL